MRGGGGVRGSVCSERGKPRTLAVGKWCGGLRTSTEVVAAEDSWEISR